MMKMMSVMLFSVLSLSAHANNLVPACLPDRLSNGVHIDLNYQFPPTNTQEQVGNCYAHAGISALANALYRKNNPGNVLNGSIEKFDAENDFSPELTIMLLMVVSDDYMIERSKMTGHNDIYSSGWGETIVRYVQDHPEVLVSVARKDRLGFLSLKSVRSVIKSYFNDANKMKDKDKTPYAIRNRNEKFLSALLDKLSSDKSTSYVTDELKESGFFWSKISGAVGFKGDYNRLPVSLTPLFTKEVDASNCNQYRKIILDTLCEKKPVLLSFDTGDIDANYKVSSHQVMAVGFEAHNGEVFLRLRNSATFGDGNSKNPHSGVSTFNVKNLCKYVTLPMKDANGKINGKKDNYVLNRASVVDPLN